MFGLLGPQRPLDRGGFLGPLFAAAPPAVADRGQHRLGNLAFATVDEFELDGRCQVRVTLDDLNVGHGETPCKSDQPDPDPGSSKPILSLGLPRSRPRAGGGWARPLPSGRGGGWGNLAARNSEPVTWPTAERSPHKSPSPVDGGAVGGLRWAQWRTCCPNLFGRPAKRRRPGDLSSGDPADGVTPSAATGAAFEPMRSLQGFAVSGISSGPASGTAGDRGDDLAGGTGSQRSGGSGPNVSSSSGLVPAQREGNQTAIPGHGTGLLRPVLPVNTGHAPPPLCPRTAR